MSGLSISRRDVEEALDYAGRMRDHAKGMSHKGEYVLGTVATQAESGLAAFGYGVVLGKFGEVKIGPAPADLLAGVGLHAAGLLGAFGKHAGHAHNFAQGLIDGYVQRLGVGVGVRMAQKAAPPRVSGAMGGGLTSNTVNPSYRFGAAQPEPLTVADVVAMADRIK